MKNTKAIVAVTTGVAAVWGLWSGLALASTPTAPTKTFAPASTTTSGQSVAAEIEEDLKGRAPRTNLTLSPLVGAGFQESGLGIAVGGLVGVRLLERGPVPDINNQLFLETGVGGVFFPNRDVFSYAAQARWDFVKDDRLTAFAIGGITGRVGGGTWTIGPRFGVGMMVAVARSFDWRLDFTQDALMTGLSFPFSF